MLGWHVGPRGTGSRNYGDAAAIDDTREHTSHTAELVEQHLDHRSAPDFSRTTFTSASVVTRNEVPGFG